MNSIVQEIERTKADPFLKKGQGKVKITKCQNLIIHQAVKPFQPEKLLDSSKASSDLSKEKENYNLSDEHSTKAIRIVKPIKKVAKRRLMKFNPKQLLCPFKHIIPEMIEKPEKSKRKATNIPKFIIKIFYKSLPIFPTLQHNIRLRSFSKQLDSSITRFHLVEIFGINGDQRHLDLQNSMNRQVLRRLLIRNFDNILSNSHIQHKRIYMLFSKKMLLRLNEPRLVGNIEI